MSKDIEYYRFDDEDLEYKPYTTRTLIRKDKYRLVLCVGVISAVILAVLCIALAKVKYENRLLGQQVADLQDELEQTQIECNYENVVMMKAGEYALHPHKIKNTISDTAIANLLKELNAWYPDIKMAIIQQESGTGRSNLAKRANNICGMRVTQSRTTTQLKGHETNGFGVYNNWESCVIDQVLWDYSLFKGRKPTRDEYVSKLNAIYAQNESYGHKMDSASSKFRQFFE